MAAVGDGERVARVQNLLGLAVEDKPEVTLQDVPNHHARMIVTTGFEACGDLDRGVDDLQIRSRHIGPLKNRGAVDSCASTRDRCSVGIVSRADAKM
jgi:hypothetical protein